MLNKKKTSIQSHIKRKNFSIKLVYFLDKHKEPLRNFKTEKASKLKEPLRLNSKLVIPY